MTRYLNPAETFLRAVRDAFGEHLDGERYKFYLDQLKRLAIPAGTWQILSEPVRLGQAFDAFPMLPALIAYCMRSMPSTATLARWSFRRGADEQRYCTKQFPIGDKDKVLEMLPGDARDINLIVEGAISGKLEYENNRSAYPEYDSNGKLTERGRQEVEEIKQQAIAQHVNEDLDAYRVRLICLTGGHRGSMRKRELDPLEQQAREWAETASETEIAAERLKAAEILGAKFVGAQTLDDLVSAMPASKREPADYDDSEIALGKQRLAQIERLEASERERAVTACNTSPDQQEPADKWREF